MISNEIAVFFYEKQNTQTHKSLEYSKTVVVYYIKMNNNNNIDLLKYISNPKMLNTTALAPADLREMSYMYTSGRSRPHFV